MGIFSSKPDTKFNVTGVIDRISDMGNDHINFVVRLVGSRTLYSVFWNRDGNGGYSLYLAKPGDRVTMIVADGQKPSGIIKSDSIVNHDF